jgi:hypothetical protein
MGYKKVQKLLWAGAALLPSPDSDSHDATAPRVKLNP